MKVLDKTLTRTSGTYSSSGSMFALDARNSAQALARCRLFIQQSGAERDLRNQFPGSACHQGDAMNGLKLRHARNAQGRVTSPFGIDTPPQQGAMSIAPCEFADAALPEAIYGGRDRLVASSRDAMGASIA
jgi:hypothetical protein